jgi:membrane protein DedA with SNARE-associated domain
VTPFAGIAGMSATRVIVPTALASGLWYAGLIAVGSALGLSWQAVRDVIDQSSLVLGIAGVVAAAGLAWWLWRHTHPSSPGEE